MKDHIEAAIYVHTADIFKDLEFVINFVIGLYCRLFMYL